MSSLTVVSRRERVARNRLLPCDADGCGGRLRDGLSRYCRKHRRRAAKSGHPHQQTIRAHHYRGEQAEVRQLLSDNTSHRGLKLAEKFVADWLHNRGRFAEVTKAHPVREALRRHGVSPREVIIAGAALWLWSERHSGMLEQDARLTIAIASAVCRLMPCARKGPKYVRPNMGPRREIGEVLRAEIGALFMNIARSIQDGPARVRDQREQLLAPFEGLAAASTTKEGTRHEQ